MARIRRLSPLVLALALLLPASAQAATAREYQLQFAPMGEGAQSLLIVSALLDPQTPLPATVTIPAPPGAVLLWSGEILGGDPAADPAREVTVERVGDMDVYTMTLEQTYTAQLELQLGQATVSGSSVESSLSWTNPGEEVLVTASVVAEPGATDVKTEPAIAGAVQTNNIGETLHPLTGRRVAEGDAYVVTVEWKRSDGTAGGASSNVLPILLGALVVAVLALVVAIARERTRARRAAADTSV